MRAKLEAVFTKGTELIAAIETLIEEAQQDGLDDETSVVDYLELARDNIDEGASLLYDAKEEIKS